MTGKSADSCARGSPVRTVDSSQDIEIPATAAHQDESGVRINDSIVSDHTSQEPLTIFGPETAAGDGEPVDDPSPFPSRAQRTPRNSRTSLKTLLLVHKYDMVLMSFLLQIYYSFNPLTNTTNLFLPIFIYSVTKIIWFPPKDNSNTTNAMLFINSVMSNRLKNVIYIAQSLAVVVRDIFVYLFVTVCIQSVYEYITVL